MVCPRQHLGPLLFIPYNNDIVNVNHDLKIEYIIYAVDTSIFLSDKDISTLVTKSNCVLDGVEKFTKDTHLKFAIN